MCYDMEKKWKYAMKIINLKKMRRTQISKDQTAEEVLLTEIAIMKKLQHENVVKLVEVIQEVDNDEIYIIMEYVENGSLLGKIWQGNIPKITVWKFFRDLIQGIDYCHNVGKIIHRDIKPENLLLDRKNTVKISDFGVSTIIE